MTGGMKTSRWSGGGEHVLDKKLIAVLSRLNSDYQKGFDILGDRPIQGKITVTQLHKFTPMELA